MRPRGREVDSGCFDEIHDCETILRVYEYCPMCMDMFIDMIMGMIMNMGMKCIRNSFPICYAKPPDSH